MKKLDLTNISPANKERVQRFYEEYKELVCIAESYLTSNDYDSLLSISAVLGVEEKYNNLYKAYKQWGEVPISFSNNGKQCKVKQQLSSRSKIPVENDIEGLYRSGLTLKEIGKIYNTSAATVMKYMKNANISRRSKSEITTAQNLRPGVKEKQRARGVELYLNRKFHNTKPELIFEKWLKDNSIKYEHQYRRVGNGHPYDFYLKDLNLLVEIDGHYWHDKPKQQLKDKEHDEFARLKGYNIIRISTKDFNKDEDFSKWIKI